MRACNASITQSSFGWRAASARSGLVLVCLAAVVLLGPDRLAARDQKLSIRFKAAVGDKATVAIRRSGSTMQGAVPVDVVVSSTYRIEVTGKSNDGYRMLWTPQSLDYEKAPESAVAQLKALAASALVPFEIDTDPAGRPVKLVDREKTLQRTIDALGKIDGVDPKIMAQARSTFTSMDERSLALAFGKEAALLALWQNADLTVGPDNVLQESRPNPFGGGMLMGTIKADVTTELSTVRIKWRTDMDGAALLADLMGWLKTMARQVGRSPAEVDAQLAGAQLTFEETGSAELDLADGWTRSVSHRRITRITSASSARSRDESTEIHVTRDR